MQPKPSHGARPGTSSLSSYTSFPMQPYALPVKSYAPPTRCPVCPTHPLRHPRMIRRILSATSSAAPRNLYNVCCWICQASATHLPRKCYANATRCPLLT
eukprot:1309388-Rhodomonas_salina.1